MSYKILKSGIYGGPYVSSSVYYGPDGELGYSAVISKILIHNYSTSSNTGAFKISSFSFSGDDNTDMYYGTLAPGETFEITGGMCLTGSNGESVTVSLNTGAAASTTMSVTIFGNEFL